MKIVKVFHGKVGGGYLTQFYPPVGPVTYLAITQDKGRQLQVRCGRRRESARPDLHFR